MDLPRKGSSDEAPSPTTSAGLRSAPETQDHRPARSQLYARVRRAGNRSRRLHPGRSAAWSSLTACSNRRLAGASESERFSRTDPQVAYLVASNHRQGWRPDGWHGRGALLVVCDPGSAETSTIGVISDPQYTSADVCSLVARKLSI